MEAIKEKVGNSTKDEFVKWLCKELTPPIKCSGQMKHFLETFLDLLKSGDFYSKDAIDWYETTLCWIEDKRAEFLKPQWIKLSEVEEYLYRAYIDYYDSLKP